MPRYDLEGQVAIVTGAGRGIGRAIGTRLASEGVSVAITDVDLRNAQQVVAEIDADGGQAIALQVDVTRKEDVDKMVDDTVAKFGPLDILVNNAGVGAVAPLMDTDEAMWDTLMDINAKGVLLCSQAAARQMISTGTYRLLAYYGKPVNVTQRIYRIFLQRIVLGSSLMIQVVYIGLL